MILPISWVLRSSQHTEVNHDRFQYNNLLVFVFLVVLPLQPAKCPWRLIFLNFGLLVLGGGSHGQQLNSGAMVWAVFHIHFLPMADRGRQKQLANKKNISRSRWVIMNHWCSLYRWCFLVLRALPWIEGTFQVIDFWSTLWPSMMHNVLDLSRPQAVGHRRAIWNNTHPNLKFEVRRTVEPRKKQPWKKQILNPLPLRT